MPLVLLLLIFMVIDRSHYDHVMSSQVAVTATAVAVAVAVTAGLLWLLLTLRTLSVHYN